MFYLSFHQHVQIQSTFTHCALVIRSPSRLASTHRSRGKNILLTSTNSNRNGRLDILGTRPQVISYASQFFRLIKEQDIILPQTYELCLELDPLEDPEPGCTYYLVDHANRTEFWIKETTTDTLDIAPVTSTAHLSG
jgi:hypothetical protein